MSDPDGSLGPNFIEQLESMGESQVRADLRYGGNLATTPARRAAMDAWLQDQELKRAQESLDSLHRTATWTFWAAIAALATAILTLVTLIVRTHGH